MQKEKPTKIYNSNSAVNEKNTKKGTRGPKKSGGNPFEKIVKEIKVIVDKALAGSTKHIAILVCGALVTLAVLAGAIYGITQIGGRPSGPAVDFNEIEIDPEADNNYNKDESAIDKDKFSATILDETEDAGQEYIDGTLFIGDSNTVRSLMYEVTGTTWNNVVGAVSMGIQHVATTSEKVVNFAGMEAVDIVTAVRMIQPKRIIITYGTNNATWDVESFTTEYKKAVKTIYEAYPYCDIIVNAIPPVDKLRDYPNITMQQIDKFNAALAEMCDKEGWKFLDSSEALKDDTTGFAKTDYTISDGIHLSKKGFEALFDYIRTHAYETEDRRPKLTYCPKRNEQEMPIIGEDPIAIRGRLTVKFVSSDYDLGSIDGEVEQTVKFTKTSDAVVATPKLENAGIFLGWECSYGGISDVNSQNITYTAPQLSEEITEVLVTAKFGKAKINISKTSATLDEGGSTTLSASVTEAYRGDKSISWSSSNEEVATVDANGKVTAVGPGTAKITASAVGGKLQTSCTVTVATTIQQIKISVPEAAKNVKVGDKALEFKVVAVPDGAVVPTVEWSSSDKEIATIDPVTGILKPLKAGKVTITVKVKDRDMKDTYELEIKDSSSSSSSSGSSSESASSSSSGSSSESASSSSGSSSNESSSATDSSSASQEQQCGYNGCTATDHTSSAHCTQCHKANGHEANCPTQLPQCGYNGCTATDHTSSAHCTQCHKANGHEANCPTQLPQCGYNGCTATDHASSAHCTQCHKANGHEANCPTQVQTCGYNGCTATDHAASAHCTECSVVNGHAETCSQYVA